MWLWIWLLQSQEVTGMVPMIPKDPVMLLSYVNTQLRDYYDSLDDFLKDKELSREGLIKKLASIDYQYDAELNQFV